MKKKQPEAKEGQGNRVDKLLSVLEEAGRSQDLERELEGLDQESLSPAELESWWHLYGIVAFREGREAEALKRFREAYARIPESAPIRFSLGQQYIRLQDAEKGFELFRTVTFPEVSYDYALAQARYAYLCGRYDDGLLFIRPFLDAYRQVKILDDHFLYVRGLPFFGSWWAVWAAFSILSGELSELDSATKQVIDSCQDYDFAFLQKELVAHGHNRPEILLETLEKQLRSQKDAGLPSGYSSMKIAVIRARIAESFEAAEDILAKVKLSEHDFPWLEDIRILAYAEAAHRFGQVSLEEQYQEEFLSRQPMLFEPDIALNFFLLRYQEKLKSKVGFG